MVLDLTSARGRVEGLLFGDGADTCRITRDSQGTDDDILSVTLALVPPASDATTVYEGPCVLTARGPSGRTNYGVVTEGGAAEWAGLYTLKIPLSATAPAGGDTAMILTSQDPAAVGRVFHVRGPVVGTFKVTRQLEVEMRAA